MGVKGVFNKIISLICNKNIFFPNWKHFGELKVNFMSENNRYYSGYRREA